jgi:pyrroline-5-carboxylate reductase
VIADRAIRQLFHASGVALAESAASPGDQVKAMIDYAGTSAAGLHVMKASPLATSISGGLRAAFEKTQTMIESDKA